MDCSVLRERRNLVSARVPWHCTLGLPLYIIYLIDFAVSFHFHRWKMFSEIFPRILVCSRYGLVSVYLISGVIPSSYVLYISSGLSIKCGYESRLSFVRICWNVLSLFRLKLQYGKSNETPTWCNNVQVLFLQSHSTCFGRKLPSSRVFKPSTAATGTCVTVAGKSSHLLIRNEMGWACGAYGWGEGGV